MLPSLLSPSPTFCPTPYPSLILLLLHTHLLDSLIAVSEEPLAAVVTEQFGEHLLPHLQDQVSVLDSKGREANDTQQSGINLLWGRGGRGGVGGGVCHSIVTLHQIILEYVLLNTHAQSQKNVH